MTNTSISHSQTAIHAHVVNTGHKLGWMLIYTTILVLALESLLLYVHFYIKTTYNTIPIHSSAKYHLEEYVDLCLCMLKKDERYIKTTRYYNMQTNKELFHEITANLPTNIVSSKFNWSSWAGNWDNHSNSIS